jgi:hypothetical protein
MIRASARFRHFAVPAAASARARTLVDGFGIPEPWLACPLLDGERATGAGTDPTPSRVEPTDLASVG